jgi:hypothetical protein
MVGCDDVSCILINLNGVVMHLTKLRAGSESAYGCIYRLIK